MFYNRQIIFFGSNSFSSKNKKINFILYKAFLRQIYLRKQHFLISQTDDQVYKLLYEFILDTYFKN